MGARDRGGGGPGPVGKGGLASRTPPTRQTDNSLRNVRNAATRSSKERVGEVVVLGKDFGPPIDKRAIWRMGGRARGEICARTHSASGK
jgi:hypothetical protein